jgi:hypothetical protein
MLLPAALCLSLVLTVAPCQSDADCTVRSARCEAGQCRLAYPLVLFPEVEGLESLSLVEPANLARAGKTPEFHWRYPEGADLLAVAVFTSPPTYAPEEPARIENFDDAHVVWLWHSKLAGGSGSSAAGYDEGRALLQSNTQAVDGTALSDGPPPPLGEGIYYWAAWAWKGARLTHRSELRSFVVGRDSVTGTSCFLGRCPGGSTFRCVPEQDFCVLGCASNADCYQGTTCDLEVVAAGQLPYGLCRTSPGCECAPDETCDETLQVCLRNAPVEAGCSCTQVPEVAVSALALLACGWAARRRRRRTVE